MKALNYAQVSFSLILPDYGKKVIEDAFYKHIRSRFKSAGKIIAEKIANEILEKYRITIDIHNVPTQKDPICNVLFFPIRKRLDK